MNCPVRVPQWQEVTDTCTLDTVSAKGQGLSKSTTSLGHVFSQTLFSQTLTSANQADQSFQTSEMCQSKGHKT